MLTTQDFKISCFQFISYLNYRHYMYGPFVFDIKILVTMLHVHVCHDIVYFEKLVIKELICYLYPYALEDDDYVVLEYCCLYNL